MRVLMMTILLAAAPLMAAEGEPAPASKASGPLSAAESKFQGDWQAHDIQSKGPLYRMKFDGRDFRADMKDQWYEGYVAIRGDAEPAQVDFVIEDCQCGFKGKTSTGIFYWDGEAIVVSGPTPGDPRPQKFDETDGSMFRLTPVDAE